MATYFITEPELGGDDFFKLVDAARELGYSLSYIDSEIQNRLDVKEYITREGITSIMRWGDLMEEMLPDNTSRSLLLETVRYKLQQLNASQSLTIVDPYLFPSTPDANLENDLMLLLSPFLSSCSQLTIVTGIRHNATMKQSILAKIQSASSITVTFKHTDDFHDRFWIADDKCGIFIGTSLNGIGKRYAMVDYLQDEDAADIAAKVATIP